jgi:solute:Na+ symporter, SSS family
MSESVPRLIWIDWTIIVSFIVMSLLIGVAWSRRGRKSVREYFTSGGSTSWWLLGTSMVATTFAADTPLALSGWVVTKGVAENWFWWCQVPVTMLGVFFIAALWRRAHLVTDAELVQLRYSGRSAAVLRGFRALFFALVYGSLIMGWVNLAMTKIIQLTLPNVPRIAGVDEAMLWAYLHTPLSNELAPAARNAMRAGKLDPLRLYYDEWHLLTCAQRTGVLREVNQVIARVEYARKRLAEYDKPPQPSSMDRPTEEEVGKLRAYTQALDAGPFLEALGLTGSERTLAAAWNELPSAEAADAGPRAPASLLLLRNVDLVIAGVNKLRILLLLFVIVSIYTVVSGLWGVLVTDFVQFWLAMAGCVILAFVAVDKLGGLDSTLRQMADIYSLDRARGMVSMLPGSHAGGVDLMRWADFLIYVLIYAWVAQFTDGGYYFAQRMLSAKNERHAALGYLWFAVAHYGLRMWPWIVVGFVAAVMFPYTRDLITGQYPGAGVAEEGYVRVMLAVLPNGLLGFLVATFLAAYMSTIATQLNVGASYLLNDFYRPFIRRQASERHYVLVSQLATVAITVFGLVVSLFYSSISGAWYFLGTISAGIGVIYLLRWFWWRINAWSEIACLGALLLYPILLKVWPGLLGTFEKPFPRSLLYLVPYSVGAGLLATFLTKPVAKEKLIAFVRKVQPGGPGWRKIEREIRLTEPGFRSRSPLTGRAVRGWILSTVAIISFLFGSQMLLVGDAFGPPPMLPRRVWGAGLVVVGCVLGWVVARGFSEKRWGEDMEAGGAA